MRVCGGKTGGSFLHVILVTVLLTEGFAKTALGGRPFFRSRRQVDETEGEDGGIGGAISKFLASDPETQQDYLRYGLELVEYHILAGYDEFQEEADAKDRVFVDSVQSVIDAVRRIDEEPGEIPAALEGLATNPDNLLLFTSLVVSTVFVAQLSSFVLFGSSLSAPLQQSEDGEEPSNDGF